MDREIISCVQQKLSLTWYSLSKTHLSRKSESPVAGLFVKIHHHQAATEQVALSFWRNGFMYVWRIDFMVREYSLTG